MVCRHTTTAVALPHPPPSFAQELGELCRSLKVRVSPKHYVRLLQTADTDGNGKISLEEFLMWWTGHCGGAGAAAAGE